jgi:ABC-type transport system substrate-binding protein
MVYPADGEAPCGQTEPYAGHAPYTGNLKRITSTDATTVVFELCRPDVAFLAKVAAPALAINDAAWLRSHIDPDGVGAQAIVTEVNGTGPYRLERWDHGSEISLARNDRYWGKPAHNERLVVRWRARAAQRVVELQGATVDGIDDVEGRSVTTVNDDVSLQLHPRPGMNVFYVGFNNGFAPFGDERVRRAIAIGIDRGRIVERFYTAGSEVASHYAPCAIPDGCAGTPWYEFDPLLGKELLAAAGFPDGFDTKIRYLEAPRSYLPDPVGIATELKTQLLDNLGIRAELEAVPEATYLADLDAGKLDGLHLLGASGSYPDVTAFLDPAFGAGASKAFGEPFADIGKALATGRGTVVAGARTAAYAKANDLIRAHVPMVPIARAGSAAAFRSDVDGAGASPLRLERFASMTPGDRRQFVWLTTSEPAGLYCADETDSIAALVCSQVGDGLYAYDPAGASTMPSLASRCAPDKELTVWTCELQPGVVFHDGTTLDASDVVMSFAVQWDAEHPLHHGRDGAFALFASWFGGLLNPPAGSP